MAPDGGAGDEWVESVWPVVAGAAARASSSEDWAGLAFTGSVERSSRSATATALVATIEHRLNMGHKVRMPMVAPYQGFCRLLLTFVKRTATSGVLGVWGAVGLNVTACEREYPLEPTFCDHWCHTFWQAGCELSPAACVQDCEESKGPDACEGARQTLLECYQAAPSDTFSCGGGTGLFAIGVQDGACQSARDTLYECASPGMGQCLTGCRTIRDTLTPEAVANCPIATDSCEYLCWTYGQLGALDPDASRSGSPASALLQLRLLCVPGDAGVTPTLPK